MKYIYLVSLKERVGKTFLSVGIIKNLLNDGFKVAYFKPIGMPISPYSDKRDIDTGFLMNSIFKTSLPYDIINPVSIPDCYYVDLIDSTKKEEYLKKIKQAYEELNKKYDYAVIEGAPSIKRYIRVGLDDVTVAQALGIEELVFIQTESSDKCIDDLFFTKKYFEFRNMKFKGVIFNKIDYDYKARIRELEEAHIKRYNIPIIGLIEKSSELLSPRVSEIQQAIGGELINEPAMSGLDKTVKTYLIAAMNLQAALKYLRSMKSAAVITGGDRTEIALAALNEDISVLVLTGFIQPDVAVISAANEKKIPILLSPSDTYTTIRNMERVKPGIQEQEINLVLDIVKEQLDWKLLLK